MNVTFVARLSECHFFQMPSNESFKAKVALRIVKGHFPSPSGPRPTASLRTFFRPNVIWFTLEGTTGKFKRDHGVSKGASTGFGAERGRPDSARPAHWLFSATFSPTTSCKPDYSCQFLQGIGLLCLGLRTA